VPCGASYAETGIIGSTTNGVRPLRRSSATAVATTSSAAGLAAAELATRTVTPLELIAECTACDRLSRMLVDEDEMLTVTSEEEPASIH
jgi:hypothetical protein